MCPTLACVSVCAGVCVRVHVRVCVWSMIYLTPPLSVGNSQKEIDYHQGNRQTIVCLSKYSFADTWTPLLQLCWIVPCIWGETENFPESLSLSSTGIGLVKGQVGRGLKTEWGGIVALRLPCPVRTEARVSRTSSLCAAPTFPFWQQQLLTKSGLKLINRDLCGSGQ